MSEAIELDGWTHVNSGKVRDLYQSEDGRVLLMVTSDRISAYDYVDRTVDVVDEQARFDCGEPPA